MLHVRIIAPDVPGQRLCVTGRSYNKGISQLLMTLGDRLIMPGVEYLIEHIQHLLRIHHIIPQQTRDIGPVMA